MADILYPSRSFLDAALKQLAAQQFFSLKQKGYVAPTVFLKKDKLISGYNYYSSKADAFAKLKYLHKDASGRNVAPAGNIPFKKDGTAQTMGMNCDFYFAVNKDKLVNLTYAALKLALQHGFVYCVFSFYKTDTSGPYWGIFDPHLFGASATTVDSYNPEKVAALDKFHREVAMIKTKHNLLAGYLNNLASRQLTAAEQQIFNEGSLRLQTMRAEMAAIDGIDVYYSKDGRIGFLILPLIAWIIIGTVAVSWTVSKIFEQTEKTKRLNASYDVQKWVSDQKIKIAQDVKAGRIDASQANQLYVDLNKTDAAAAKNAEESAKNTSMFGDVASMVKWGVLGLLMWKGYDLFGAMFNSKKKSSK